MKNLKIFSIPSTITVLKIAINSGNINLIGLGNSAPRIGYPADFDLQVINNAVNISDKPISSDNGIYISKNYSGISIVASGGSNVIIGNNYINNNSYSKDIPEINIYLPQLSPSMQVDINANNSALITKNLILNQILATINAGSIEMTDCYASVIDATINSGDITMSTTIAGMLSYQENYSNGDQTIMAMKKSGKIFSKVGNHCS